MELRPPPRPTRLLSQLLKAQLKKLNKQERIRLRQRKRPTKMLPMLLKLKLLPLHLQLLLHAHPPVVAHSESRYD